MLIRLIFWLQRLTQRLERYSDERMVRTEEKRRARAIHRQKIELEKLARLGML